MKSTIKAVLGALLLLNQTSAQQVPPTQVYKSDFNSTFKFTPSQIENSQLPDFLVTSINDLITSQQSYYAFGGVDQDDFYTVTLPNNTSPESLKPGQILKVQQVTDTNAYALPPGTAMSRIIYTTTNYNGTIIPASGYILWPYLPRTFPSQTNPQKANLILWTHGTAGVFAPNAPSANRFLQYWNTAPYPLVQAGYVIFAPDYAGLGVRYSFDGTTEIPHQYMVSSVGARDALYGLRSIFSFSPFSNLFSGQYIIMGHSQGGSVAWSAAELLASSPSHLNFEDLIPGYKGTIPLAPVTNILTMGPFAHAAISQAISSIYPDFKLSNWLTPLGIKRLDLAKEIGGEIALFVSLFGSDEKGITDTVRPDFHNSSWHAAALAGISNVSGRDFLGPMLVLQGEGDFFVLEGDTARAIDATEEFGNSDAGGRGKGKGKGKGKGSRDLEYVVARGAGHTPILDVARSVWMGWIEDRFSGKEVKQNGFVRREISSLLDWERYSKVLNSVPLWAGLPEFGYLVLGAA